MHSRKGSHGSMLEQVIEDVEIGQEGLVARVVSVSRQHRHTLEHTGLMRWESCLPLARFLLSVPSLTQGDPSSHCPTHLHAMS